ncbi:GNAT family N-acetyltransferase [Sphingobacterium oryzagri]|uniref:GNAT family N-acetyltransferase n=1 Tax=Sphingobacterium oryzagri TaxID=3025669 RepID=A0ABY7WM69_9SPHI|nr:GNAT family N-acetyltransferase [Sphingobacterium sp. KACC 22765]WDF69400.1 GNAT family N-acetyltransferase [Sphingobacterium sp. KACC 22765]
MIERIALDRLDDVVPLFDAYRQFYQQVSDLEAGRQFLQTRLAQNESVIYVAYQSGKAVGFTQLYPTYSSARMTKNWILNDLYVIDTYRRCGIGEQLIAEACAFAKADGASFVRLSTQVENKTAQKLYRKVGFQLEAADTAFLTFKKADL